MSTPKRCPQCGADLPADDLAGHCPRCLVSKTLFASVAEGDAGLAGLLRQVGDYELIEEIARGGMGVVYRARQISLNRTVALKMILAGEFATPESVRRFRNEAEAAARLRHPNIVTIHQVDEREDQHYFVMELIDGPNFAALVRDGPLPARRAAGYLKSVAEAVAHAHSQRILHRDLKPSNILLDPFDQPKVTDFGLARRLDTASDLTLTGQAFGSPGYMPPEQAGGGQVTEASDLYSLGAVLYHLLTGRPPFQGETVHSVLKQVESDEPLSPRRLNPSVPTDLETICLKCLDKDPARRYASGQDLADELGRFLRDEPIRARPLSRPSRLFRWVRRHPAVSILGASVLLLLLVVAVGSSIAAWRVATARQAESTERQKAQAANRDLVAANSRLADTVRLLELRRAEDLFRTSDSARGVASLASILRRDPSNHIAASRLVSALVHGNWVMPAAPSMRHVQPVESVSFSPDGRHVLTVSRDAYARIWDAITGRPSLMLRHGDRVNSARYNPDGRRVVTASSDATSRIWNATNGAELAALPHKGKVLWAEFSPDGLRVATVAADKVVRTWDSSSGQLLRELRGHTRQVYLSKYSPDGTRLATGGDVGSLRIWNVDTGELILRLQNQTDRLTALEFSPDGSRLVWAGDGGIAQLWDPKKGVAIGVPLVNGDRSDPVWRATFSPDSRTLLTASQDGWARLWDATTGHLLEQRFRHEGGVTFGAFSPDGRIVVTSSTDNTARLWDVGTGQPLCQPLREQERILQAAFSPDGLKLVTGAYDWNVQVWDIRPRAVVATKVGEGVRSLAFSPDGRVVLVALANRTAALYDAATGQIKGAPLLHPDAVTFADFSPDGGRVVTVAADSARVFDLRTGGVLAGPMVHANVIRSATFHPTGERVLTCSVDGTARIWSAQTGQPIAPALVHRAEVITASFSHDGRMVVTASEDHSAQVWDSTTGQPMGARLPHLDHLKWAEFSPDDRRVVTASTDNTACIWDVATSRPVAPLLRHARIVEKAAFSPDGRRVVTGSLDQTARVWDSSTGQALTEPLKHDTTVARVCFGPDGRRIATGGWNGAVRLWDVETGLPLTEWLNSGGAVTSLQFDPAGNRLAAAARSGGRLWDLPGVHGPVPSWFPALAETIGGLRLGSRGNVELVPRQDLDEFRARLATMKPDEFYARVGQWLLADPSRRERSPF
jgi:WD40 repeat protein/serine/threonine protein kinase